MSFYPFEGPGLILWLILSFILGLVFGSFLNVCISRLPVGESVRQPRSRCPACKHPIHWYDNIPVLSWLLLRGRCRDCRQPIPLRYPLVELGTGFWFCAAALRGYEAYFFYFLGTTARSSSSGFFLDLIAVAAFGILGFLLIGLLVMDWQTHLLPDAFTLTGIAIGVFLVCTQAIFLGPREDQVILGAHHLRLSSPGATVDHGNIFLTGPESLIFGRMAAVCAVALLLLAIRWLYQVLRHREGLGLGDVKLLAMIAAFLGFWPAMLALFAGVLTASAYAILLLLRGKAGAATKLPLGSFLAIGGLIAAQYGTRIIDAYRQILR